MRRVYLFATLLMLAASPSNAQEDPLGTLTFDGPGADERHVITMTSMFFNVVPGGKTGDDAAQSHSVTLTTNVSVPDPALIAWATGPNKTRGVLLEIKDDPDVPARSTFKLDNAAIAGLSMGYAGSGRGSLTLEIQAEHMSINGTPVY